MEVKPADTMTVGIKAQSKLRRAWLHRCRMRETGSWRCGSIKDNYVEAELVQNTKG